MTDRQKYIKDYPLIDMYFAVSILKVNQNAIRSKLNSSKDLSRKVAREKGIQKISKLRLMRLYNAAHWKCFYCGRFCRLSITIDHVVPLSKGGTNEISNLLPACKQCNNAKANMSLGEFAHKNGTTKKEYKARIHHLRTEYRKLADLSFFVNHDK
jgi:5-methylcytosine-specific restriction endonuclease McrA